MSEQTIGERLQGFAERLLEQDPERWGPMLMPDGSARQRQWSDPEGGPA